MKNTVKRQGAKIMKNIVRMVLGAVVLLANLVPLAANAVPIGGATGQVEYFSGKVGIGLNNTDPGAYALNVLGDTKLSGALALGGTITVTGTVPTAGWVLAIKDSTGATEWKAAGAASITPGSITNSMLAADSVDTLQIKNLAITSAKIFDGTILDADISATAAISSSKIALEAASINAFGDVIANDAAESMYVGFPYGLAALGPATRYQTDAMKWNTSFGYGTLTLAGPSTLVSVTRNTALGYKALAGNSGALTNASQNTAVGDRAMQELMVGSSNTAVGSSAMNNLRTGGITQNTAVGTGALFGGNNSAVSSSNVAIGASTLYSVTNSLSNVAVGTAAMYADTTGSYNTAVGNLALSGNTTGANNIAVGADALKTNTTGYSNTVVGAKAMSLGAGGTRNVVMGTNGMMASTTGDQNVALGYNVLANNTTGYNNVALGSSALMMNSTGNGNTAIGWGSLIALTTGKGNIAIGDGRTGGNLQTGSNNIVLGNNIAFSNPAASNNIVIGNNALVFGGTNTLNIGNYFFGDLSPSGNTSGNFGIGAGAPKAALHISKNWEVLTGPQELLRLEGKNTGTLIRFTSTRGGGLIPNANEYNLATIMAIDENAATPTWGGSLRFATSPSGTTGGSAPVDRMVIASNGDIGIGTAVPAAKLHVVGDLRVDGTVSATAFSGTISSSQIADGSVTPAKLADGAVIGGTGGDIADNTITNADISPFANIAVEKISNTFGYKPAQYSASAIVQPTTQITTAQIDPASGTNPSGLALIGTATSVDYTAQISGAAATYPEIGTGLYSGQMLVLRVTSGWFKFENKASRRLILASPTVTLDSDDTLVLMWDNTAGAWLEISRSLNTRI